MSDAIIPVGRDCDCGHPMIWRAGDQVCAVYGRHPADDERVSFTVIDDQVVRFRNRNAPGAALIAAVMAAPNNAPSTVRHRRNRERARAAAKAVTAA